MPPKSSAAKRKTEVSRVRSSAAEYLTFVAASGQGGLEAVYADENVWLSQKMMGLLHDVETHTVNYHLRNIFADHKLEENSVIQFFRITAADGKTYDTGHYNLSAFIAVGYKVNSERAVQFRKWATGIIESFTIKGFAMDTTEPILRQMISNEIESCTLTVLCDPDDSGLSKLLSGELSVAQVGKEVSA